MTNVEFKAEVLKWSSEIGVKPVQIQLRKMSNKWGSCSSKGRLTFNEELLTESFEVRTNAIVHELLHLRYPNHGKMFKKLLNIYLKRVQPF